jgi:hypothetical protein
VREKEREREDKRMGKLATGGEVDLSVGRSWEASRNQEGKKSSAVGRNPSR